jgi:3-oxoadipate enol-lactonase
LNRVPVRGGELEYEIRGDGEPVLLIHGSHVADAFLPLTSEPALADYRLIRYRRRGYAGSAPHEGPFGIAEQAEDALAVLRHLNVSRGHVVGHSYGALTALQLAHAAPAAVHSLSLLEPPLMMVPSAEAMGAALTPAVERYQAGDPAGAVDAFMQVVGGPEWRVYVERTVPGGAAQAEADAATFFEIELPALAAWRFDGDMAATISAPVLHVLASESGRFYAEGRDLVGTWFPKSESRVVDGLRHLLQVQDPEAVADTIARFIARHPM